MGEFDAKKHLSFDAGLQVAELAAPEIVDLVDVSSDVRIAEQARLFGNP